MEPSWNFIIQRTLVFRRSVFYFLQGESMEPLEIEPQPKFTIMEMSVDEIESATEMRLASWLDTYVNEEIGVTREWIELHNIEQVSAEKALSKKKRFTYGKEQGTFNAWVAKDTDGTIMGSTIPFTDDTGHQHLGSLYVDKKWHGTGVGSELMVVTYNSRARAFYQKWGFEEVPGSDNIFEEKIPEIKMIRKAQNEV
jgi:GNAT superfamily N-acetyltransferase